MRLLPIIYASRSLIFARTYYREDSTGRAVLGGDRPATSIMHAMFINLVRLQRQDDDRL